MTQTIMPIILPVHTNTTKEVNCIMEQGVRYCEKPLGSNISQTMVSGILVLAILWIGGLLYVMNKAMERDNLFLVIVYVIAPALVWFILSLIK